jgi:hypothetical protein
MGRPVGYLDSRCPMQCSCPSAPFEVGRMRQETHDRLAQCETPVTMALGVGMLLLVIWTQGTSWPMWAYVFTSGPLALAWALVARRWLHPKHWFLEAIGTAINRPGHLPPKLSRRLVVHYVVSFGIPLVAGLALAFLP